MNASCAPSFEKTCQDWVDSGSVQIVLDFGALAYISSLGLGSLVKIARHVKNNGGSLCVCRMTGLVKQVGTLLYIKTGAPPPGVRLAILPFTASGQSKSLSDGLLQDTADWLRCMKNGGEKLTVIPARDALRNKVDAPQKAAALPGATHTLTRLGQ